MPVSGSTDFTLNARDVVTYALKQLRVVQAGDPPRAEDMDDGLEALNLMLKSWQVAMPNLWRQTNGSLPLVSGTSTYSLPNVYRIMSARFRQSGRDIPMFLLTRDDYEEIPLKTSSGIPTQYYFDPQRDGGQLYVWPVMSAASGETIEYTYQRRFYDVDTPDDALDLPQEYLMGVGWNLAEALLETYGKTDGPAQRIMMMAARYRNDLQSADREDVVRFVPGRY